MRYLLCVVACLCCLVSVGSFAETSHDVYRFANPTYPDRFQQLTHLLRCPKCQDQSIADSSSEIAGDMREKTAELLRNGKTNDQIVQYFVARYGEFVTFKPPLRWDTLFVWGAPFLAFLFGLILVALQLRHAKKRWRDNGEAGPKKGLEDS